MKRIAIYAILFILYQSGYGQADTVKIDSFYILSPVELRSIKAGEQAPFSRINLDKNQIAKLNMGQDIPLLLNQTPSVVIHSDAGNGVGYTGIRIRGTDATRINVTLNGIPYNDAESQGTFFVDLPDISSSMSSIQVQRGVGTSSNGAGAFGASIHFSTNELIKIPYAEINNSYGSFDTWKHTVKAGTGLIGDHFTTDIRLSKIASNGFIDRASSDLKSIYFSTAYTGTKNSLRLNIFSGKEKTYQAWYGISEADLNAGKRTLNYAGMEKPGKPYDNETDNFQQDHYQLFYDQRLNKNLVFNTALFLTKGEGFYEQYKADEIYADYSLPNSGITDLIRQLWLDNDYYGSIFSLQFKSKKSTAAFGGAVTRYKGKHFGEIIWASNGITTPRYRWYDHRAFKNDLTLYLKEQLLLNPSWSLFGDLQFRHVNYRINGFRDNPGINIDNKYDFFNPKAGVSYHHKNWKGYLSYGLANKEPNRDDFEAGLTQLPKREQLHDVELNIGQETKTMGASATFYYMYYRDQLVLTGKINDVGAYTRTNIPKSYRAGMELQGYFQPLTWLQASANLTLSRNKIRNFTEYLDDYDNGGQKTISYHSTDLAFSPSLVAGATLSFIPCSNLDISLPAKYVGDQYLDNTEQENRKLESFYVQDLRASFSFKNRWLKQATITGQFSNVFGKDYEPNGYTFSYIYGGEKITENYYFPMAGRTFLIALNIKL